MPAPVSDHVLRPDSDVNRIPDLSEWIGRIAQSDASIWAAYLDFKDAPDRVQK